MARHLLGAALAGLLLTPLVLAAAPAQAVEASARCRVHAFPVPDGTETSQATAGSPSGRWIAGYAGPETDWTAVRWRDNVMSELDVPLYQPRITGITRKGDVVGYGLNEDFFSRAFAIVDGDYVELTAPGATNLYATGISAGGRISGNLEFPSAPPQAVVWDLSEPDDPVVLEVPDDYAGSAVGVGAHGAVALLATYDLAYAKSYIVGREGKVRRLRPTEPGLQANVLAIGVGWAAGIEIDPGAGDVSVVRWDLRDHRTPQAIDSSMDFVMAVNADGVIGGQLAGGSAGLIIGTKTKTLPGLTPGSTGSVHSVATNGLATGFSFEGEVLHAAYWTC